MLQRVIYRCTFHHPYVLGWPSSEHRTCIYLRTIQAVGFGIGHMQIQGACTEGIYAERGSGIHARIDLNGEATEGMLRTGKPNQADHYQMNVNVDGSAGTSLGRSTKVLVMDQTGVASHVQISGDYRPGQGAATFPLSERIFIVHGTAKLLLRDFTGRSPNSVQRVGNTFRSSPTTARLAELSTQNCTRYAISYPNDVVVDIGAGGSVAP